MFKAVGFELEEIDLRDYFGKRTNKLAEKLASAGSFWSSGGNVFILRRAFAASGLDKLLIDLLKNDEILYGGWSAGAMIMAPDLKGGDWGEDDKPNIVPKNYTPEIIWEGLDLINFYIVPHVGNKEFGNGPQSMIDYYEKKKLPYKKISDGQVITINGDKTEILK